MQSLSGKMNCKKENCDDWKEKLLENDPLGIVMVAAPGHQALWTCVGPKTEHLGQTKAMCAPLRTCAKVSEVL